MKKTLFFLLFSLSLTSNAQTKDKIDPEKLFKELTDQACSCIDSIPTYNRIKDSITANISSCIDDKVGAYQIGEKFANIDLSNPTGEKKEINVTLNLDKNSTEYKDIYYKMEKYLMDNCSTLKDKVASNNQLNKNSMSTNQEALDFYNLGIDETKKDNFKGALEYYKKAVKIDPNFAFAYDNMGICYRRLEEFDLAIDSYEKSLKIDPNGLMPLQNIAVAYSYKKEYKKAVKSYEKLAKIESNNPEVFYGIGQMYALHLNDPEKGLDNMCKAYNLYVEQKSPYRADAEKIIQMIYADLKKAGKEDTFNKILAANNIKSN
ncbi:tetratricopeptide repeat protein [Flavobacterium sp. LC2016-12]|uniref:tetratricopeptide repeat protein n=1 Tax=Flavobacterium sp. LC2016-12 TaxID=2783794 RepID=UPI00188D9431|nr:tetratricopeptide repeat protein [Flavobacterium sp. LC2016-12]MBF4467714.1 tetratricopeptide repeat protein [Flavobacterium sp. LC2016-12]